MVALNWSKIMFLIKIGEILHSHQQQEIASVNVQALCDEINFITIKDSTNCRPEIGSILEQGKFIFKLYYNPECGAIHLSFDFNHGFNSQKTTDVSNLPNVFLFKPIFFSDGFFYDGYINVRKSIADNMYNDSSLKGEFQWNIFWIDNDSVIRVSLEVVLGDEIRDEVVSLIQKQSKISSNKFVPDYFYKFKPEYLAKMSEHVVLLTAID